MQSRWLVAVLAGLLLAPSAWTQDGETEVQKDKGVKGAAKKTKEAKSYSFELEFEVDSDFGGGMPQPEIKGRYEEGEGFYIEISSDQMDMEIVRIGKKVAVNRDGDGWEKLGGRRGGGGGGGQGFGGGMGFEGMISRLKAPHDELMKIEKNFKKLELEEDEDRINNENCKVWKGALTEKGAENSLPMKGILEWIPNAELEGEGKIWINEDGYVVKYEYETTIIGDFNGNEFEVTVIRSVTLTDIGETEAEIPDDVKELFEEDEEEEKDEEEKDEDDEDY